MSAENTNVLCLYLCSLWKSQQVCSCSMLPLSSLLSWVNTGKQRKLLHCPGGVWLWKQGKGTYWAKVHRNFCLLIWSQLPSNLSTTVEYLRESLADTKIWNCPKIALHNYGFPGLSNWLLTSVWIIFQVRMNVHQKSHFLFFNKCFLNYFNGYAIVVTKGLQPYHFEAYWGLRFSKYSIKAMLRWWLHNYDYVLQ